MTLCPCGAPLAPEGWCKARAYPVHLALFPLDLARRRADDARARLMALWGLRCDSCGSALSDVRSRARGVGPHCWRALVAGLREGDGAGAPAHRVRGAGASAVGLLLAL